ASEERKTVGPRWPALTAASIVRRSRGSATTWLTVSPRKRGPSTRHLRRARSEERMKRPLRVPTRIAWRGIATRIPGASVLLDERLERTEEPARLLFLRGRLWLLVDHV